MANREKSFRKKFIEEHWKVLTDKEMYDKLLETEDPAPTPTSITRMRQREGLVRDKEMIYRLRDGKENNDL